MAGKEATVKTVPAGTHSDFPADPFRASTNGHRPSIESAARGILQHDVLRAEVLRLCAWVHPEEVQAALEQRQEKFEEYRSGEFFRERKSPD